MLEGSVVSGLSIPAVQTFATKSFATELCPCLLYPSLRTFVGNNFQGGFSDHLPVFIYIAK